MDIRDTDRLERNPFEGFKPELTDSRIFIDRLEDRWSGGDLLLQICADDPLTVAHSARVAVLAGRKRTAPVLSAEPFKMPVSRRNSTLSAAQSAISPASAKLPGIFSGSAASASS